MYFSKIETRHSLVLGSRRLRAHARFIRVIKWIAHNGCKQALLVAIKFAYLNCSARFAVFHGHAAKRNIFGELR